MAGDFDIVEESDLAAEACGDADGTVVLNQRLRTAIPERDFRVFLERDSAALIAGNNIGSRFGAELGARAARADPRHNRKANWFQRRCC